MSELTASAPLLRVYRPDSGTNLVEALKSLYAQRELLLT